MTTLRIPDHIPLAAVTAALRPLGIGIGIAARRAADGVIDLTPLAPPPGAPQFVHPRILRLRAACQPHPEQAA